MAKKLYELTVSADGTFIKKHRANYLFCNWIKVKVIPLNKPVLINTNSEKKLYKEIEENAPKNANTYACGKSLWLRMTIDRDISDIKNKLLFKRYDSDERFVPVQYFRIIKRLGEYKK